MSGTPPYVELHAHSAYSFLDGASLPDELIARAAELGHTALAITDHDSRLRGDGVRDGRDGLAGACDLRRRGHGSGAAARRGAARRRRARHLTLLVRDGRGWRNLCRLLTLAHAHTRERPTAARVSRAWRWRQVLEHADGLVCLTGCAEHGIARRGATARPLLEAFGPDSLRVELQRPYARGDRRATASSSASRDAGHARGRDRERPRAHAQRASLQDAFVAVRHGT